MLLFCRISTGKLPHYRQDQESASKCCLFFDASLFAVAPEAGIALVVVVIADSGMVRDGVVAMAEAVSAGVVLTGGVVVRTGGVGRAVGRRAGLGGMRRAGVVGRGRGVVTGGRVVGGGGGFGGRGLVRRRRSGGEQGQRGHDQRGGLHFLDLKTEKKTTPRHINQLRSLPCGRCASGISSPSSTAVLSLLSWILPKCGGSGFLFCWRERRWWRNGDRVGTALFLKAEPSLEVDGGGSNSGRGRTCRWPATGRRRRSDSPINSTAVGSPPVASHSMPQVRCESEPSDLIR